ncbi:hypothetical protein AEAC466_06165 [Asticcacaulis sp. AC466]|nr:hypothetical protein AEAC466_06165 [Asticcacaulis sp. AC466]
MCKFVGFVFSAVHTWYKVWSLRGVENDGDGIWGVGQSILWPFVRGFDFAQARRDTAR